MKTIKSILGLFVLTAFMSTTAFAQDNQNQDVDVQKEVETDKGEAEYSYEKETDDGEVEKDADYYSDVDTEQRDSETDLEHESETEGKSSGLTQEDLDRKAEKAGAGQDDTGSQDAQQQNQDSRYLGSADNQQENRTEIEPERLPDEVTESITDGEYASWTISRVYEISPEGNQSGSEMSGDNQSSSEENFEYTQDQSTQLGQERTQNQNEDAVLYEIYFMNPDDNQVETQRFDQEGNAR